ncbi:MULTISPECIES: carbohydrate ABC transporter permease [Paenibacillus]|uniref:carbohydrate ABC transporter permease n=1 Tax=Paenibacillus TaxID=44249 RepID=UPI0020412666|nr:sugar ABC transporter permease [Paenibacillus camelliae]MCM3633316.1 sugar ABC transporter permease [Paenibacillus camelliae]
MISEKNTVKRIGNQLLFTGPTLLAFIAVIIVPFIYGIYMTFFKWDGISSSMPYVGFNNYEAVFNDTKFWTSVWLTIKYVAASVFLINTVAFLLAYLVTMGIRGQNFFRTAFFSPNLIGGLVLGFIWQFMFNNFFTSIGEKFGWELFSKTWLGNETMAFWALVLVTVWQYAGYMMVIFIAGLMSVPKDILEAATIDGTSGWKQLIHMVLPLMVPSFIVTIFLSLQRGFMVYDVNYALTGGGPFGSTVMASMHVYDKAFQRFDYGVGQAEAFVLFFIVATVTIVQVYLTKRMEVEA